MILISVPLSVSILFSVPIVVLLLVHIVVIRVYIKLIAITMTRRLWSIARSVSANRLFISMTSRSRIRRSNHTFQADRTATYARSVVGFQRLGIRFLEHLVVLNCSHPVGNCGGEIIARTSSATLDKRSDSEFF